MFGNADFVIICGISSAKSGPFIIARTVKKRKTENSWGKEQS